MNVNYVKNRDISFNGFYNNKALKKSLEFAADNGALFGAVTTLALSTTIRPLVILSTPNTDKKNKQIACAKSLTSTLNGYLITLACSLPIAKSIKKINKNPEKYLKKETLANLKENTKNLTESPAYQLATQLFKLGIGFLIATPKAILTAIGTPYMLKIFGEEDKDKRQKKSLEHPSFKGKDKIAKGIGKILDNKAIQNFAIKNKDSNFPLHVIAATDTLTTLTFIEQTKKNKNLNEKDKKPLINNTAISTVLSIISTYIIDSLTKDSTENFIKKYKKANKNDPNLLKQIEGIKIAKPILIAGAIYYVAIPLIATFTAERIKK